MLENPPEDGEWYSWAIFERWAEESGVGAAKDDWELWWECWKKAYTVAMNEEG